MKHLKPFENFSVNEGKFKKFFTGHESSSEKEAKKSEFFAELDDYEEQAANNPNMVFNREYIEKKAKDNNYKGTLDARRSANDNKLYVTYRPGRTGLEELGAVAGSKRDNPLN
jgi:hypothetical protein